MRLLQNWDRHPTPNDFLSVFSFAREPIPVLWGVLSLECTPVVGGDLSEDAAEVAGGMASVCVFCGSRTGDHPEFVAAAKQFGRQLAAEGHTMVYGGGSTGIMGAIADAMLENNGCIIGVIPEHLAHVELMHADVTDMRITRNMHERKALMHELSDVYVTLPGGFGTMEELFEAVTWAQLELHARPIVLLNQHGLYDGIVDLVASMTRRGFLSPKCQQLMTVVSTVDELIEWLQEKQTTNKGNDHG